MNDTSLSLKVELLILHFQDKGTAAYEAYPYWLIKVLAFTLTVSLIPRNLDVKHHL